MTNIEYLQNRIPFLWINPNKIRSVNALLNFKPGYNDILEAESRLQRFAPLLVRLFPELASSSGVIDSELMEIANMASCYGVQGGAVLNSLYIKGDHGLAISGSVKARGGFYAVFVIVERILSEHGLSVSNILNKSIEDLHSLFTSRTLVVGSTGNLGLSIGLMGRAFGFSVTVHMSSDAKNWKKEKLRSIDVTVIEHESDYSAACRAARLSADKTNGIFFIDDENSIDLFLGYSAAASMLSLQLKEKNIIVDADHPLFVYIPCGVGGAPGGITFGLKHIYGDNVHCFFAEPVEAPAMMLGLVTGKNSSVSVKDIGLTMDTCADGLAVGSPSELVSKIMATVLDGCFTVAESDMLRYPYLLKKLEGIRVEPSAAAGFAGLEFISNSKTGEKYLSQHKIQVENITHIVWTTGGAMEPEDEYEKNFSRGLVLNQEYI